MNPIKMLMFCGSCENETSTYKPELIYINEADIDKVICQRCASGMNRQKFEKLEEAAREVMAQVTYQGLIHAYVNLKDLMEDDEYKNDDEGDKMWAGSFQAQPTRHVGKPRLLFEGDFEQWHHDISPDGRRFLMVKSEATPQAPTQINVVLNWFEEVKERVSMP